jgi:hypothetical protein
VGGWPVNPSKATTLKNTNTGLFLGTPRASTAKVNKNHSATTNPSTTAIQSTERGHFDTDDQHAIGQHGTVNLGRAHKRRHRIPALRESSRFQSPGYAAARKHERLHPTVDPNTPDTHVRAEGVVSKDIPIAEPTNQSSATRISTRVWETPAASTISIPLSTLL